jgi:serine protease Do
MRLRARQTFSRSLLEDEDAMKTAFGFGLAMLAMLGAGTPGWAGPAHSAQGYLGVDVRDVAPDQVATLKLKDAHGAEIVLVDHDAPAGKCGLHEHDVVLMMNGQAIEGKDQLRHLLHDSPPGANIVLIVSHDGQQRTVTTQMAVSQEEVARQATEQRFTVAAPEEQPTDSATLGVFGSGQSAAGGNSLLGPMVMNPSYTGLYLEKMSAQLAGYFGVPNGSGLLVRSVQESSPAAVAGMLAGDVVIRANDKTVVSTNDWAKAIKSSHGHSLTIVVLRDKKEQTLTLTPDSKKRSSLDPASIGPNEEAAPVAVAHVGFSWMPLS